MNKTILAVGADIKSRFLLAKGRSFQFGPEIGDLSEAGNFTAFKKQVQQVIKKIKPNIIACDLHPNYFSSLLAKELSGLFHSCSLRPVQHHHAHIASVMQEHNLAGPVIGISFDGTGFGRDGNSWGGEFILAKGADFKRLGHLQYRKAAGGDKVVSEPWRMLLSILGEEALPFLKQVSREDKQLVLAMLREDINSPLTSSAGRLFDAAAVLLGICLRASYEAEGPIKLEAICDSRTDQHYQFTIVKQNGLQLVNTDGLFSGMVRDLKKKTGKSVIAAKFHNSMAEIIAVMARRLAKSLKIKQIALSGGVFQNKFLKTGIMQRLSGSGLQFFTNDRSPVNDLNIPLGQYYVSSRSGKG